jgi:hypothetical protein
MIPVNVHDLVETESKNQVNNVMIEMITEQKILHVQKIVEILILFTIVEIEK